MFLIVSYLMVTLASLGALHTAGNSAEAGTSVLHFEETRTQRQVRQQSRQHRRNAGLISRCTLWQGLTLITRAYLAGFVGVELYVSVIHNAVPVLQQRLEFAPLMLTSVYCSLGVLAVWVDMAVEWVYDAVSAVALGLQ